MEIAAADEGAPPAVLTREKFVKLKSLMLSGLQRVENAIESIEEILPPGDLNEQIDKDFKEELGRMLMVYQKFVGTQHLSDLLVTRGFVKLPDPQTLQQPHP
jgi:methyl-accepting chemotaxis protein